MASGLWDLISDYIYQLLFLLVAGLLFFSVIAMDDPSQLFKVYEAKDLGLTVSALYSVPGRVLLKNPSYPGPFSFNFTRTALLVSDYELPKKPPSEESGGKSSGAGDNNNNGDSNNVLPGSLLRTKSYIRKVYGMAEDLSVTPKNLTNPLTLFFLKTEQEIMLSKNKININDCFLQISTTPKGKTRLSITDKEELLLGANKLDDNKEAPASASTTDNQVVKNQPIRGQTINDQEEEYRTRFLELIKGYVPFNTDEYEYNYDVRIMIASKEHIKKNPSLLTDEMKNYIEDNNRIIMVDDGSDNDLTKTFTCLASMFSPDDHVIIIDHDRFSKIESSIIMKRTEKKDKKRLSVIMIVGKEPTAQTPYLLLKKIFLFMFK